MIATLIIWTVVIPVLALVLATKMAKRDCIFTTVEFMTAKAVMRYGGLRKMLINNKEAEGIWKVFGLGGLRILGIPGMDKIYQYIRTIKKKGEIQKVTRDFISLKEEAQDFQPQNVFSHDPTPVRADAIVFTQVVDPQKALFAVEDWLTFIKSRLEPILRGVIGEFSVIDVLTKRMEINRRLTEVLEEDYVRNELNTSVTRYGIEITRIEFESLMPKSDIVEALEKGLEAKMEAARIEQVYSTIRRQGVDIKTLETLENMQSGKFFFSMPELGEITRALGEQLRRRRGGRA